MTPSEAEEKIVECVQEMDRLRATNAPQPALDAIDAVIVELKKITGPRKLEGEIAFTIPMPGSTAV